MINKTAIQIQSIIQNPDKPYLYTVYLLEKESKYLLPIEVDSIFLGDFLPTSSSLLTKPSLINTARNIILGLNGTLVEVYIHLYLEGIHYCYLKIWNGKENFYINTHVANGICLAHACKAPIYTNTHVLKSSGIKITKKLIEKSIGSNT